MRNALACVLLVCALAVPVRTVAAPAAEFAAPAGVLQWTFGYRENPEPERLPEAVGALYEHGLLSEEEKAGYFIGFAAGVLGSNPDRAAALIERMLPLPPKEQAAVVRAIAYSGLPGWPALMVTFAPQMSERELLINAFLSGAEPELLARPWEDGSVVVYTLWGYYVATGDPAPVRRVIRALKWTGDDGSGMFSFDHFARSIGLGDEADGESRLDRRVIGATAKWTLVSYAEHHRELLDLYRAELAGAPGDIAGPLGAALEAAERFEAERIRTEEAEAVEVMKQRLAVTGSSNSRAAYAGSVGIATGCVIAGAFGHVEIAGACVVTGALYSGAMKIFGW